MQIFHKYAQRVRLFSQYSTRPPQILIFRTLLSYSNGHPLPKLEGLTWMPHEAEVFPYLRLFLCPSLKCLNISFDARHQEQFGFLSTIPVSSPSISSLCIDLTHYSISLDSASVEGFLDPLETWRNLSELQLRNVPLDGLLCTAGIPKLKKLKVTLANVSEGLPPDSSQLQLHPLLRTPDHPYPALEELGIWNIHNSGIALQFFRALKSVRLSRLDLGFTGHHDTLDAFRSLFFSLGRCCDMGSLKVFQFSHHRLQFPFSVVIEPLLTFTELREVRICLEHAVGVSEKQMIQIASSWPHIELLHIAPSAAAPSDPPSSTLLSLVPLANGCPKLRELSIWVNASDAATRRTLRANPGKAKGVRNSSLWSLNVGCSPISHKELVASFLFNIFPNLEDISPKYTQWNNSQHTRRWQYVAQVLLPMLSRARYGHSSTGQAREGRLGDYTRRGWTARYLSDKVEERDGEWSDSEQLKFK